MIEKPILAHIDAKAIARFNRVAVQDAYARRTGGNTMPVGPQSRNGSAPSIIAEGVGVIAVRPIESTAKPKRMRQPQPDPLPPPPVRYLQGGGG